MKRHRNIGMEPSQPDGAKRTFGRLTRLRSSVACALGLATLILGATMVVAPTMASASPSCSGSGCNGRDPYTSGCAQGAYEVTSAGRYLTNPYGGTNGSIVHLFWSPSCRTNWTVVTQRQSCSDIQGTRVVANVLNRSTGQWVNYAYGAKTAPTYVWGNMVYSPGPAQGYGDIDCNGPYDYTGYTGVA